MAQRESSRGLASALSRYASSLVAFGVVIAVLGVLFLVRDRVKDIESFGYAGVFLINLAASASFALPVPGVAVAFALGGILNPILVAMAAASGATLGELTGYLVGYMGNPLLAKSRVYGAVSGWMRRYGALTLFLLAAIPNPVFDIAGAMAGALRYPVWKFLAVILAGKLIKFLAIALAGDLIAPFFIERFL